MLKVLGRYQTFILAAETYAEHSKIVTDMIAFVDSLKRHGFQLSEPTLLPQA